ncbi:hypothetical protein BC826DRAFT_640613 [Russula brevipes]|nr:hypothetical protein BC826DRAFT_640613 [Russula brevipes]
MSQSPQRPVRLQSEPETRMRRRDRKELQRWRRNKTVCTNGGVIHSIFGIAIVMRSSASVGVVGQLTEECFGKSHLGGMFHLVSTRSPVASMMALHSRAVILEVSANTESKQPKVGKCDVYPDRPMEQLHPSIMDSRF